jgi:hypothetical protein
MEARRALRRLEARRALRRWETRWEFRRREPHMTRGPRSTTTRRTRGPHSTTTHRGPRCTTTHRTRGPRCTTIHRTRGPRSATTHPVHRRSAIRRSSQCHSTMARRALLRTTRDQTTSTTSWRTPHQARAPLTIDKASRLCLDGLRVPRIMAPVSWIEAGVWIPRHRTSA